jgi:hypothetical protein
MFFIFGSPRSGTTLLAQTLSAHSDLVVPHETDFIIPLAFIFDRIKDEDVGRELITKMIVNTTTFARNIGEYVSADDIRTIVYSSQYELGKLLARIYAAVAKVAGRQLAGDKSPDDLLFLRMLVKTGGITPETKIIHIVRDIRDVMVSLTEQKWVASLDLYFPRFWSNSNLYLHSLYRDSPSQYMLIHYEELVSRPKHSLENACRHLGVEFQSSMLDPATYHPRYRKVAAHSRLYEPISSIKVGSHTDKLDKTLLRSYEKQAREGLEVFGYQLGGMPMDTAAG